MGKLIGVCFALALAVPAYAQSVVPPHGCIAIDKMKELAKAKDARWIELTRDQWSFLRTVSAISPSAPLGFPYGDHAALARKGDNSMVVFIDGSRACDMMPISQAMVEMLNEVSEITHEPPQGVSQ